jgi:hypothetical protein
VTIGISEALVRKRLQDMLTAREREGRRPSVLALARQLGLSNTTFRRHYPEIAREINHHRSQPADTVGNTANSYDRLVARNAKLRRRNHELTSQLKLATAQIQYLALRAAALEQALEDQAGITHLSNRRTRS